MIGGMEDEERERQQREWGAWRAKQMIYGGISRRRATNRRERENIKRGYLELTEPLTTHEKYKLHNLKGFDKWEKIATDGNKE